MKKISELSKEEEQRAIELHEKAFVVNAGEPTFATNPHWMFTEQYLKRLAQGGVDCVNSTVVWSQNLRQALRKISDFHIQVNKNRDKVSLATSTEDIKKAYNDKKLALLIGFQNAKPLEDDIDLVHIFYKLGVRIIQLTYQKKNFVGDGCGERTGCGLSNFGVRVIEEMNKLGIILDLSHVGYKSSMDGMEITKGPPIFSHSNAYAINEHVRNVRDDQLKALAEKGGVIGMATYAPLVKKVPSTLEDYLDHTDYVANLIGVDHVGIGLDYNEAFTKEEYEAWAAGFPEIAKGFPFEKVNVLDSITNLSNITKGLVARGYSDKEITKILGGNFMRVFEKVLK